MKKLYVVLMILAVLFLSACVESGKGDKNTSTGLASPMGIQSNTNTATPSSTPIPTFGPKSPKEVEEELKNIKVNLEDLMNEEVVYPAYFGAVEDN